MAPHFNVSRYFLGTPSTLNQTRKLEQSTHFSMARTTPSKRHRLLGLVKPSSNSTPGLGAVPLHLKQRAHRLREGLARMKRFFCRLKKALNHRHDRNQPTVRMWNDPSRRLQTPILMGGAGRQRATAPTQDVTDQGKPEPTLGSAGRVVDAAVTGFDGLDLISPISQDAIDYIGEADDIFIKAEDFSDRYQTPMSPLCPDCAGNLNFCCSSAC